MQHDVGGEEKEYVEMVKQVRNVMHAGWGGILNAVGRDKNVLEEVGKKCRRKTRKSIRW